MTKTKKFLWTFGVGTMFGKKYIIVETDTDDGREVLFEIYGKDNMCNSYLIDECPEIVDTVAVNRGLKCIAEWTICNNQISVKLTDAFNYRTVKQGQSGYNVTEDFKEKVWDEMLGGI